MLNALEQFFSEDVVKLPPSEQLSHEEPVPLQRINTGATIVGADNGSRVGGFVLVVDDSVLLEVNKLFYEKIADLT